jgi:hypothetical protein
MTDNDAAIAADKQAAAQMVEDYQLKHRVEHAAIAIFSAMQANPNWNGSGMAHWDAVQMAKRLIREIDHSYKS